MNRELYDAAYKIFNPFLGLISWKRKGIISAFQHSLNTAAIAGELANLLTDDDSVVSVATYCGLLHDLYQKAKSLDESLTREKLKNLVLHVLEDAGLEKNEINRVINGCNYNVAENPGIWLDKYRLSAISVRLADVITSSEDAFDLVRKVREDVVAKDASGINLEVVSIFIPQVMLRSFLYSLVIQNVKKQNEKSVFILARNGLVIITKDFKVKLPIDLDYMELKKMINFKIEKIQGFFERASKKKEKDPRIERFAVDSNDTIQLDKSIDKFFTNVRMTNVKIGEAIGDGGAFGRCMICGLPNADPTYPAAYGRIKYKKASTEIWSPRYPGCINLNQLFQQLFQKMAIYICPLCILEALIQRKFIAEQRSVDYIIQYFFTKPFHYEVAQDFAMLADDVIRGGKENLDLETIINEPWKVVDYIYSKKEEKLILLDFTWTTYLKAIGGGRKELEDFVEILPDLSKAIILTGIYPVKFSHIPDPSIERRIIMPVHPLYDYDVNDDDHGKLVPLTLFALTLLHELEGGEKKIRVAMDYLSYPFWVVEELLMMSDFGRKVLKIYDQYIKNPYIIFKK